MRRLPLVAALLTAHIFFGAAASNLVAAAEIYSNGTGGGPWSDAGTWRGGVVPKEDDDVVLARDDTVLFDRNDDGKVTCHLLALDPRSVLQFKTNAGPITFVISGAIDSYGAIKLDATKAATDRHELRFVAATPEERTAKFSKGGSLVVAGRPVFGKAKPNAVLRGIGPEHTDKTAPPPDPTALVELSDGTTLDAQRAEFENIYLQPTGIDNTGAKPGERVNIVRNRFIGTSRLLPTSCDTILIADNLFETAVTPPLQQAALYLNSCPLADVRGNTIRGTYAGGITFYGGVDISATNNLIEKVPQGFYLYGINAMIRGLTIRDCGHALTMTSASGALEDVLIERCSSGYYHGGATVQATNLVTREMNLGTTGYHIHCASGPLTLVNCPFKPEQIQFAAGYPMAPTDGKQHPPPVQMLHYLIVEMKGTVPAGTSVDVLTVRATPLPAGASDPNIRNAPAMVASSGYTPFPKSLEPLIVRGWCYNYSGQVEKAPDYQLRILAPQGAGQAERAILKTVPVTPQDDWYREKPNDKKPTVEVTLP